MESLYVVLIRYTNELQLLNQDERTLRTSGFHRSEKVYAVVSSAVDEDEFNAIHRSVFYELIDLYENAVTVHVTLPRTDKETLNRLGIATASEYILATGLRPASPVDSVSSSPDVASDDSLSHLERERALSDGEGEEEDYREGGAATVNEDSLHDDFQESESDDQYQNVRLGRIMFVTVTI